MHCGTEKDEICALDLPTNGLCHNLVFVNVSIFHFNILQDVERECLNKLNVCLIIFLVICYVLADNSNRKIVS